MTDRLKTLTSFLPLLALVGVALVYVRAWAIFRQFDPSWLSALSAADIFGMGWAMFPAAVIATGVGLIAGGVSGRAARQPSLASGKRLTFWKIVLVGLVGLLLFASHTLTLIPIAGMLPERVVPSYPFILLLVVLLFAHSAFRVTPSSSDFLKVVGPAMVAVFALFWDWEGATQKTQPDLKRIRAVDGEQMCAGLVFGGQTVLFLWDPAREEAVALERKMVAAVTDDPDCSEPGQD